ncbi:MAG: menaquinone biosynthesis protein [Armatimonadetes bacterium]|nr:menaquinone biosynthesis protein [Armatimonadota bacterium]
MKQYRVGSVPYVNAKPLVHRFGRPDSPVDVVLEVPSQLPTLLESGNADAILVSSYDYLSTPGRAYAPGVCIGSRGAVESVRLFSKVPIKGIESLALDQSSLTSNNLALGLLADRYHIHPNARTAPPSLEGMLAHFDACVLIGDIGMMAPSEGLVVMDLGAEWVEHTNLPFVWALWVSQGETPAELARLLQEERDWGVSNVEEVARLASVQARWPYETTLNYLSQTIDYTLDASAERGLAAYRDLLERHLLIRKHEAIAHS